MKSWFRRQRLKWQAWQLRRKLGKNENPLREFLYLDDVSVYSLLASKSGAIPTDFTDKKTRTWTSELSGTGEATLPSGKLGGGLKAGYTRAAEAQVARKAIVQSTFRDFREGVKDEILLREPEKPVSCPDTPEKLTKELAAAAAGRYALNVSALERGQLFELNVELEADNVFRTSSVIEALADIVDELPPGLKPKVSQISDVVAISKVMDKLLVGLVPLRCRVIDFDLVSIDGQQWVLHRDLTATVPSLRKEPLYVVGVTESQLYWKDLRRIVFSKLPVRLLGRISTSGIKNDWSSMKLGDVMSQFSPDFAKSMRVIEDLDLGAAARSNDASSRTVATVDVMMKYAAAAAEAVDQTAGPGVLAVATEVAQGAKLDELDFEARIVMLERFEKVLGERGLLDISQVGRDDLMRLREEAFASTVSGLSQAPDARRSGDEASKTKNSIDCEVVAIYW